MKKISLYLSLLFLTFVFFLPRSFGEEFSEEKGLAKKGPTIEEEIDSIIREIRALPPVSPSSSEEQVSEDISITTKIISPVQITQTLVPPDKRDKRMDLIFDQANLEDVLSTIGDTAGINIVLDPVLKGKKVDVNLKDVPIEEALSLIYTAYSLGSYQIGTSLYISSKEKIKQEMVITKIIKLRNINASESKALISKLVEVVNFSEETNTLVIVGNPEDVFKVESILTKLDVPQPQVILEAQIVEIESGALKEIGVNWSGSITATFQEGKRPKTFDDPMFVRGSPFRVYKLGRSPLEFLSVIHMLETDNKAKVLSNPRVTTINNKEAEIFVGKRIPYTVRTMSGGETTTEVKFVEPGIRLKITPSIIEKEFVVIKIEPEVSTITGWRGGEGDDDYPEIKTREATAYVRVKNGHPFVMGGLLSKEDVKEISKVPFFGDVPLLGNLFKYKSNEVKDTELIITVVPNIVQQNF